MVLYKSYQHETLCLAVTAGRGERVATARGNSAMSRLTMAVLELAEWLALPVASLVDRCTLPSARAAFGLDSGVVTFTFAVTLCH